MNRVRAALDERTIGVDDGWLHNIGGEAFAVVPDCFDGYREATGLEWSTARNQVAEPKPQPPVDARHEAAERPGTAWHGSTSENVSCRAPWTPWRRSPVPAAKPDEPPRIPRSGHRGSFARRRDPRRKAGDGRPYRNQPREDGRADRDADRGHCGVGRAKVVSPVRGRFMERSVSRRIRGLCKARPPTELVRQGSGHACQPKFLNEKFLVEPDLVHGEEEFMGRNNARRQPTIDHMTLLVLGREGKSLAWKARRLHRPPPPAETLRIEHLDADTQKAVRRNCPLASTSVHKSFI